MSQTYIGSTVRMGSGTLTDGVDGGFTTLMQVVQATTIADGTAVNAATITLPVDSQIVDLIVDVLTAPVAGAGSATEVIATIGTAAAGTQYSAGIDVIAAGRYRPTFTAAQLTAMSDIDTTQPVVFTLTPDGTISTTQGVYQLTVVYAQKI